MAGAAAWGERPRQSLSVPAPYSAAARQQQAGGCDRPSSGKAGALTVSAREGTLRALRDKLTDVQAENSLLGSLVRDLRAERDALSKKLAAASKQAGDASSRAAATSLQAEASAREQRRLASEVERLSSAVRSHSICLEDSKAHTQELEGLALDLRQELEEARQQLEAARAGEQAAVQRGVAAEAKLLAAGLGSLPRMGPTAEQLILNSTQRIKELTDELVAAKAEREEQEAAAQQRLASREEHWQRQLREAQAAADRAQREAERKLQQQEAASQQQAGRLLEAEQQCRQLQELLVGVQPKVAEGQSLALAQSEMQSLRRDMLKQSQGLQQQVKALEGQLADAEVEAAKQLEEQQAQLGTLRRQLGAAQRERQELSAALVAVRQMESTHRLAAGEAAAKVERLRGQLVRCVGELQAQLEGQQQLQQRDSTALQQLRAAEAAAAAARQEAADTRQQLVELACATISELRQAAAGDAVAITGLPPEQAQALPLPVSSYVKVLEHAVCECEQRCKQLLADAVSSQQQEQQLRQALASAREQQAAAERALQQQTQRLLALERMRLSDLQEAQQAEKQLVLSQQECWNLRDALISSKAGQPQEGSGSGGDGGGDGTAAGAAAASGGRWRPSGAGTAGETPGFEGAAAEGPSVPAAYTSKLEQLRQLKQQLGEARARGACQPERGSSDGCRGAAADAVVARAGSPASHTDGGPAVNSSGLLRRAGSHSHERVAPACSGAVLKQASGRIMAAAAAAGGGNGGSSGRALGRSGRASDVMSPKELELDPSGASIGGSAGQQQQQQQQRELAEAEEALRVLSGGSGGSDGGSWGHVFDAGSWRL